MTYGHLQADCLYTGISSGPNARYRVWEAFTFTFLDITYMSSYLPASSDNKILLENFGEQKEWGAKNVKAVSC